MFFSIILMVAVKLGWASTIPEEDSRVWTVEIFMTFRDLYYQKELEGFTTAKFKHNRRVQRLVWSPNFHLAGFNFEPEDIKMMGEEQFQVKVEGLWTDRQGELKDRIYETLTFIKSGEKWLADGLKRDRIKKARRLVIGRVLSKKDLPAALKSLKSFLRAWKRRDAKKGISCLSNKLKKKYSSGELISAIVGLSNPHHAAFQILKARQLNPNEFTFVVATYESYTGFRGIYGPEGKYRVVYEKGKWVVDNFP